MAYSNRLYYKTCSHYISKKLEINYLMSSIFLADFAIGVFSQSNGEFGDNVKIENRKSKSKSKRIELNNV